MRKAVLGLFVPLVSLPATAHAGVLDFACAVHVGETEERYRITLDTAAKSGSAVEIRSDGKEPQRSYGAPTFFPNEVAFSLTGPAATAATGVHIQVSIDRRNLEFVYLLSLYGRASTAVGLCVKVASPRRSSEAAEPCAKPSGEGIVT
jgi:hypothetical protein